MTHRFSRAALAAVLVALVATLTVGAGSAGAAKATAKADNPKFTTEGGVAPQFLTNARTIPHFTFQYTDLSNGVTYPITMVGSDPRSGNVSTTVKTVIVPLKLNFVAAGQDTSAIDALYYPGFHATPLTKSFDGGTRVADVLNSPIFKSFTTPADMGGDTAQVGDAFMRAQFGKIGTGYHVQLQNVKTYATQVIDVPASKGVAYNRAAAESAGKEAIAGIADDKWFSSHLQNLINSLQIDPTTVPIFLTDNVMLYSGTYDNCCTIGYHGAGMPIGHGAGSANGKGNNPVQTFIYAAWSKPGTYSGFYSDYSGTRSYQARRGASPTSTPSATRCRSGSTIRTSTTPSTRG